MSSDSSDSSGVPTIFSPQNPSRRKRARQSSSEDWDAQYITDYLLDLDVYRISYPGPGILWPCDDFPLPSSSPLAGTQDLFTPAHMILRSRALRAQLIRICTRHQKACDIHMTTFCIQTSSVDPTSWEEAARAVHSMIQEKLLPDTVQFQVEICNPSLMNRDFSFPIPSAHPAVAVFNSKRTQLEIEANADIHGRWASIGLYYRAPDLSQVQEDLKPTILVSYRESAQGKFGRKLRDLRSILAEQSTVEIEVEFVVGEIKSFVNGGSLPRLSKEVSGGNSIGVAGNFRHSGTLGGFLRLSLPDGPDVQVGLTCYHVLQLDNNAVDTRTTRQGIRFGPHDLDAKVQVQHPSTKDLQVVHDSARAKHADAKAKYDHFSKLIVDGYNSKGNQGEQKVHGRLMNTHQATLGLCQDLSSMNRDLGAVVVASGKRVGDYGGRLDWGLFQVRADPFPRNHPVADSEILPGYSGTDNYAVSSQDIIEEFADICANGFVVKRGRTTNATCGVVNGTTTSIDWTASSAAAIETTKEWEITSTRHGKPDIFSLGGDSGAWVTDSFGRLVGVIMGGNNAADRISSLIMPIKEVLKDITRMTNGGEARLP